MFNFLKYFGISPLVSFVVEDEGGSGNTPPEGDTGSEQPVDDNDLDDEGWVAKRGAKNVREELKRKNDEFKKLKEEYESFKTKPKVEETKPKTESNEKRPLPPHLEKLLKKWVHEQPEGSRVSEDFMRDILEAQVFTVSDGTRAILGSDFKHLTKAEKKMAKESLSETIDLIGNDPLKTANKFTVAKYKKEIIEAVEKEVKPDQWDNKDVIDYIVAKVYRDKTGQDLESLSSNEPSSKAIQEGANIPGGQTGGSVSEDELREAAASGGLDLSDAEDRKFARRLAISRQKIQEAKNKK